MTYLGVTDEGVLERLVRYQGYQVRHTMEALYISCTLKSLPEQSLRDSLVDDGSTPWHHGQNVLGKVEERVAAVSTDLVQTELARKGDSPSLHVDIENLYVSPFSALTMSSCLRGATARKKALQSWAPRSG